MPRSARPAAEIETALLREFLAAGDGCVSGAHLAQVVGLSRVAVWGHLHRLEAEGFAFEPVHSRGYRLTARPAGPCAALIRARLPTGASPLVYLDSVDSTNDEAGRQLTNGRLAPFVVLAAGQTLGRGRFGRVWHSPAAGNLYLSFAFRPELPPERVSLFTLWMGLNLCDLLAAETGAAPQLKWPNDLHFGPRKVAGMLTEARVDADQTRELVFGLGLNVATPDSAWPRDLAARATTLAREAGRPLDLNAIAAAVVARVLASAERFFARHPAEEIAKLWRRHNLLAGRTIVVRQGDETHAGTARGIDAEGSLLLRTAAGRTLHLRAGEVTLRAS
jgi:BirA family transcriptional regulator, biotin operon repressor / biotin---[acetyl-CoA-carboxylase] ligase